MWHVCQASCSLVVLLLFSSKALTSTLVQPALFSLKEQLRQVRERRERERAKARGGGGRVTGRSCVRCAGRDL